MSLFTAALVVSILTGSNDLASSLSLPDGPGSVRGLADRPEVDAFTGQAGYSVAIELPHGPAGFAPNLAITYRGDTGNGSVGLGWNVEVGGINRSLEHGVPSYTDADELNGSGAVSGRLVPVGPGEYRLEGRGNQARIDASGEGFVVTNARGVRYSCGLTPEGRISGAPGVASWLVEKIVNLAGQSISYSYMRDGNALYLGAIHWGASNEYSAVLHYIDRADRLTNWRRGFGVATNQLLDHIDVQVGESLLRRYDLTYSHDLPVSRLAKVTMLGRDGSTALPSLMFGYKPVQPAKAFSMGGTGAWSLSTAGAALLDLDRDGFADLVDMTRGAQKVYRNLGGSFADPVALTVPDAPVGNALFIDTSGDGLGQIVIVQDSNWHLYTLDSTRAEAVVSPMPGTSYQPLSSAAEPGVATIDINGDGRTDLIRRPGGGSFNVRFGTGTGLGAPIAGSGLPDDSAAETRFVDINGDGVTDALLMHPASMGIYIGHGDGTFTEADSSPFEYPRGAVPSTQNLLVADLNRDGLADFIRLEGGDIYVYGGDTMATFAAANWHMERPLGGAPTAGVALADVNGNGTVDVVWSSNGELLAVDVSGEAGAGLLERIDNGLGEHVELSYQASAVLAWEDARANTPWTRNLHVSMPVVIEQRIDSGGGDPVVVTQYRLRDGFWDTEERRMGGFLSQRSTAIAELPEMSKVEVSYFIAGEGIDRELRGRVAQRETYDGLGNLFARSSTEYQTMPVANLDPNNPLLRMGIAVQSTAINYERSGMPVTVHATTAYDAEGNPVESRNEGRTDMSGDESVQRSSYAQNDDLWVRNVPVGTTLLDDANQVIQASRTFYDGDVEPLPLGQVGRGWARRTEGWLASEARWVVGSATNYDTFGNPTQLYQGGKWRTSVFDVSGTYTQEEYVEPAPGQRLTWAMEWDTVLQRLQAITGPDGITHRVQYDALGRATAVVNPDGELDQEYLYDWEAPRPKTVTLFHDGAAGERRVDHYHDGAGNLLFQATKVTDSQWIISHWKRVNMRGQVVDETRPFYTADPNVFDPNAASLPRTLTQYDALGRVTRLVMPNGSVRVDTYLPDGKRVQGDTLAPVTYRIDGQGRIFHTERSINGNLETADAAYDAAGRMTSLSLEQGAVVSHYAYDTLGRLVQADDSDLGTRSHKWADEGWVSSSALPTGQSVSYVYDSIGRLTTQQYDDGTTYRLHYDVSRSGQPLTNGRLAWIEQPSGEMVMGYDDHGNAISIDHTIDGETVKQTFKYSPSGFLLEREADDGFSLTYTYDAAGRLTSLGDYWQASVLTASGAVVEERYGNGLTERFELGAMSEPLSVEMRGATKTLLKLNATYTSYGVLEKVEDTDGTGLDHSAAFTFDSGARLTQAQVAGFSFGYAYDGLQNLVQRDVQGPRGLDIVQGTYQYDAASPRRLIQAGTLALQYDDAGRPVQVGDRKLTYDAIDRLTQLQLGSTGSIRYRYGFDGARVRSQGPNRDERIFSKNIRQEGNVRTHYVRNAQRTVAEVRMPVAKPAVGALRIPFNVLGVGLLAAWALVFAMAVRSGHRLRWVRVMSCVLLLTFGSQCGSCEKGQKATSSLDTRLYTHASLGVAPALISDAAGEVIDERRFEPFGAAIDAQYGIEDTGMGNCPIDMQSGWADHGARWDAPQLARWLTPDALSKGPTGASIAAPWDLNPYQMTRQNPVLYKDENGHIANVIAGAAIGAAVGAAMNGGFELGKQLLNGEKIDLHAVAAQAAGGAVSGAINGAIAGSTFGVSIVAQYGVAAVTNAAGQAVARRIETGHFDDAKTMAANAAVDGLMGSLSHGLTRAIAPGIQKVLDRTGKAFVAWRGQGAKVSGESSWTSSPAAVHELPKEGPRLSVSRSTGDTSRESASAVVSGESTRDSRPASTSESKVWGAEKGALHGMAEHDKLTGGITKADFGAYKELNQTLPKSQQFGANQFRWDEEGHAGTKHSEGPHAHAAGVDHIPIKSDKQ